MKKQGGLSEADLMRTLQVEATKHGARLWRNQVGTGLAIRGRSSQHRESILKACQELATKMGGSAQRITYGLPTGSGDLIGYAYREIKLEHVGSCWPVFASAEVKTATGRPSDEQRRWNAFVLSVGGVSGIVRSMDDLRSLLKK